ncbi:MAG: DUF2461 domain-containing protein [Paludibacteraceae bacterium]|nr:DUF2461 domain-containing protein [Paludibacteraceae bacterium]
MDARRILHFLSELAMNNNREWFNANKQTYLECKQDFEEFVQQWIDRMGELDPQLRALKPADCNWRIYRDTRFSPDKTPYKDHFGSFIAAHGGKKSEWAGWYLHMQPGHCMFASGMWCPEPELLRAVRTSILDNSDELEELMVAPEFRRYFTDFDTDYMLRKVPAGFPADAEHADWLKRKTFTLSCHLTDEEVCRPDFLECFMSICRAAKPVNDFLNYTFEEM